MDQALIFVYLFCIVISWGLTEVEVSALHVNVEVSC